MLINIIIAPFCNELSSDGATSFYFTHGTVPCTPPPGFETYFGPAPHYRFIDYDGIKSNDVLERIRDMPEGRTAEDVLRELLPDGEADLKKGVEVALDALYQTMEEYGPFDGICAYSEGATVAATLILDEQRRWEEEGRKPQIKAAVFFSGWPPLLPNSNQLLLMDDSDSMLEIPTCHVVGSGDPYLHGAMALFNVCSEDVSHLFDHGKGHTIPRDARTIKELGVVVRAMIKDSISFGY